MLKQLLSDNRIFSASVCVIVFIAGGLLYLQVVKRQARHDVQRTQDIIEQHSNPQTGEVDPQPAPGGHYHPDGTYHVGPHEAETPPTVTGETEAPRRVEPGVSPSAPGVLTPGTPHLTPVPEAASKRTLDPQTQLKVDKLYAEAERLSAEADMSSNKLYAESQELQKKLRAFKAENASIHTMPRNTPEEKQALKAFRDALDKKMRALNAETIRLNDLYIQNGERRDEAMRLRAEARALGGTQ